MKININSPSFRWMPGMGGVLPGVNNFRVVAETDGGWYLWSTSATGGGLKTPGTVVDTSDPATVGALLHLAREVIDEIAVEDQGTAHILRLDLAQAVQDWLMGRPDHRCRVVARVLAARDFQRNAGTPRVEDVEGE